MARYVVTKGHLITNAPEPVLSEGAAIPDGLLTQWGETGLEANLEIGAVIAHEGETHQAAPTPAHSRRDRR
jgi:hypothetical protein